MEKETKKSKADGEKRKRKSTHRKDEKKSRGKQKKKDNTTENQEESNQSKEKESESPSASRPPSPEPNCSICLGDLQNKSFTDSCFHMFCFVCLKEWSKVKAECPLCKQKFQNIIYNVKSYEKYDRYNIAEEEANRSWECDRRFRYRTTLTFERRLTFAPEHDYHQPIARPSRITTRSHWQRYRQPSTSEFRRRIYANGLQATEVTDRRLRVRDVSPSFFRKNPATTHRLVPWLNRELNSLLHNQSHNVQTLIEIIMGLIKSFSIDSEEFYQHVYPYVGRYTRHFMHEFLCFAKSPYNMATYDQHVIYQPGTLTVNSDSNESSIDLEDNDFVDDVIDLEGENSNVREPPPERRGHTYDDNLSPLLQTVRDILEERPGSSLNLPLSMSGWDSPTPGPSWLNLAADLEIPLSSITGTVSVVGNRESSPIDIASGTDSDSDSTESVSSTGSDIVFVKMDKPWDDRSPIMLSSGSDTDENTISLDFINRHYAKRKQHVKKKDHKKHKEHKKHKYSGDTDTTKERSKHKKHRRHHLSDKSERRSHSSSKHRDSGRSRSSSKPGDNIFSLKSSDNSEKSVHKEKHKKHKKHKKHEHHKKSKKLQSVVVLPNNSTVMRSSANTSVSTESLISSASAISEPTSSGLSSTNMSPARNILYKKHSSGHKKSGKLTDIVPKLLEKSRDMSDSKRNDNSEHFESKDTKNNSKESFIDFESSELVLSLQNSRRCLKCGLLYIPELLDNFDICFTCKKKKVCETESRSLSDVIHQLTRQKLNVHSTSNDITFGSETLAKRTDNVVIQEGSESSLRPALNQVDLTSIDSPLFGTSESDNDDCGLFLQEKHSNPSSQERQIPHSYQPPGTQNRTMSNSLNIEFSNPSTPVKGLSQTSIKTGSSGSPPQWILEVSNPPTPSSSQWPGYMSPNYSPKYPSLESLFPHMLPSSYSNSVSHNSNRQTYASSIHGSANSPMCCSSVSRNPIINNPENPITIDLENDLVDMESIDKNHCKNVGNMSISSAENICSSDSNQSGNSLDLNIISTKAENYSLENKEENGLIKCQTNSDLKQNVCQSKKIDRMDTEHSNDNWSEERKQLCLNFDESFSKNKCFSLSPNLKESDIELAESADVDMSDSDENTTELKCVSYYDCSTEDENNEHSNKKLYSDEGNCLYGAHNSVTSSPFQRSVPRSLEEKLAGLADFPPFVLQRINAENGLSFHNTISDMAHKSNKSNSDGSVDGQSSMHSDTEVHLGPETSIPQCSFQNDNASKCSNSLFVSSSNIQIDSFNENLNSMDKFEMQNNTHGPFSVAMNSVESGTSENLDDMFNDNSNCVSLKSQVRSSNVESDDLENVDETCHLSMDHRLDFPQFSFEKEDAVLGMDASKDDFALSRAPATSSDTCQFSPSNQMQGFAVSEEVCSPNNSISNHCNEDRSPDDSDKHEAISNTSDDTENFIALHQTEFSSESDLENCLSRDSEDDTSPTVEYRVDILHSEKALSENLANILENSDSLDSN